MLAKLSLSQLAWTETRWMCRIEELVRAVSTCALHDGPDRRGRARAEAIGALKCQLVATCTPGSGGGVSRRCRVMVGPPGPAMATKPDRGAGWETAGVGPRRRKG